MAARIHTSFSFNAGLIFNNTFYANHYTVDCSLIVESESIFEQNVAMDRIKYFIGECLDSCVFVHQDNTDYIDKFVKCDLRVCPLPEEPYDQVVGIMLLTKLNNITENRLTIFDLSISSSMSDNVSCMSSIDESVGPFALKGWWSSIGPNINDIKEKNTKIVSLKKYKNEWDKVGLSFKQQKTQIDTDSDNSVVISVEPKTP